MDILTALPVERRGMLTMDTGPKLEEARYDVKYLGNMVLTEPTASSKLVDKVIDAAIGKQQKRQDELRSRAYSLPGSLPVQMQSTHSVPSRSASVSEEPALVSSVLTDEKSDLAEKDSAAHVKRKESSKKEEKVVAEDSTGLSKPASANVSPKHNADAKPASAAVVLEKEVMSRQDNSDSGVSVDSTPDSSDDSTSSRLPRRAVSCEEMTQGRGGSVEVHADMLNYKSIQVVLTAANVRLYDSADNSILLWERKLASVSHCCQVRLQKKACKLVLSRDTFVSLCTGVCFSSMRRMSLSVICGL